MNAAARHLVAAVAITTPLAAGARLVSRAAEGTSEAGALWQVLGTLAPAVLWGLPLAYAIYAVATLFPRHPKAKEEPAPPRDATLVDRRSLSGDSREGW